jgi:hypothetical protein
MEIRKYGEVNPPRFIQMETRYYEYFNDLFNIFIKVKQDISASDQCRTRKYSDITVSLAWNKFSSPCAHLSVLNRS